MDIFPEVELLGHMAVPLFLERGKRREKEESNINVREKH